MLCKKCKCLMDRHVINRRRFSYCPNCGRIVRLKVRIQEWSGEVVCER
jgi:uncharacterized paraquat-inducible protein A